ncbi:hypothetical protein GALMADRAFT_626055 [Galerina marginata CBS 339.88]|uniref:Uncharacterized protein n=1 Tax=Galerina marginata (strain CBS 339.88) TaxID=685588 RepID=A0A067T3R0_GALM3|nr:hypothetical protein GALMADRAFT_626055 [Galerina marginata CBS 339.88]
MASTYFTIKPSLLATCQYLLYLWKDQLFFFWVWSKSHHQAPLVRSSEAKFSDITKLIQASCMIFVGWSPSDRRMRGKTRIFQELAKYQPPCCRSGQQKNSQEAAHSHCPEISRQIYYLDHGNTLTCIQSGGEKPIALSNAFLCRCSGDQVRALGIARCYISRSNGRPWSSWK